MRWSLLLVFALVLSLSLYAQENAPVEKAIEDLQKEVGAKPPILSAGEDNSPCSQCPSKGKCDKQACDEKKEVCPVTGKSGDCPKACDKCDKKSCEKKEVCPVTGKIGNCPAQGGKEKKLVQTKLVEHVYHVNIDGVTVKLTLRGNEKAIWKILAKEVRLRKKIGKLNKSIAQVQEDLKEIYKEMGMRCPVAEKMFSHWVNKNKAFGKNNWEMLRKALEKARKIEPPAKKHVLEVPPAPVVPEVKTEVAPVVPEVKTEVAPVVPEVKTEVAPVVPEVKPEVAPEK